MRRNSEKKKKRMGRGGTEMALFRKMSFNAIPRGGYYDTVSEILRIV
jgi:hypothetical protein